MTAWLWRTRFRTSLRRTVVAAAALSVAGYITLGVLLHAVPFPEERLTLQTASTIVTDRTGQIMARRVADDDHWSYPVRLSEVSPWAVQATIAVEDERFRSHGGVDLLAVVRAAGQNIRAGRTVSGASTITMQVCRMMDNRPRTWPSKAVEAFRALQLDRLYSKDRILEIYLNTAPYGGNIRGIEAAAWRYFGKSAADLTLGEAALLAGLPQSPARLRPDRHAEAARARRHTVLRRMAESGMISGDQRLAASTEPLHLTRMQEVPLAPHAAALALARRPSGGRTTIDPGIQNEVARLVADHTRSLPPRTQVAVVVIDIPTGDILALVGSADFDGHVDGQVNGVTARRSPGSALKPFVYAAAFEERRISPDSIVYDVPVNIAGWLPRNFDEGFAGEVTAAEALRRSLNIPAILVAQGTGLARVLGVIESAGIALPPNTQSRAGLGVVVGTAEVTLLDLTNGYATLGRGGIRLSPRLFLDERNEPAQALDGNVCAALDDILSSHRRRPAGLRDLADSDVPWFMWKTGTSSLRRDAWAVGHNRRYAIGVWAGRFAGAGNAALIGATAAEPLLAGIFNLQGLRTRQPPPPAASWPVRHPLGPPPGQQAALSITSPEEGAVFIAMGPQAIVHPTASYTEGISWFLDGSFVGYGPLPRLPVRPGQHILYCTDKNGAASTVSFQVRSR